MVLDPAGHESSLPLCSPHTLTHFSSQATSTTTENIFSGKLDSGPASSCTSSIQLPHLTVQSHFLSLQGTEQMLFFFSWCFLEKPFSSNREWTQTTTKQALLTQKLWGWRNTGTCRHSGDLKWMSPSFKCFLWPFVNLMHSMWIKLFWTCYCNDSQINLLV